MDSANPFVQVLGPDDGPFENYDEVSSEDNAIYALQGLSLKFNEPEKLTYLNRPARFIAFDINEENKVVTLLIFLDDTEMLTVLKEKFGEPDLNFEMDGQAQFTDGDTGPISYTSYTWFSSPYMLTFSLFPLAGENGLKSRILIRNRDEEDD